jgi:DNA-directed RNA polymerase subunit RPC12/RpoP
MLDIKFACPECGAKLSIDYRGAGLKAPCPRCRARVLIPRVTHWSAEGGTPVAEFLSLDIRCGCPHCRKKLVLDVVHAGREFACPGCRQYLLIPAPPANDAGVAAINERVRAPEAPAASEPHAILSKDEMAFLLEADVR